VVAVDAGLSMESPGVRDQISSAVAGVRAEVE
jgi:hypothetical protein